MGFIFKECLRHLQLLLHTRLRPDGDLFSLQCYYLQGSLSSVCVATLGADFHLSRPVLSHPVIYIHTCIHTYIYTHTYIHLYTYIHTFIHIHSHIHTNHTYIHAYIHTLMHMRAHIHAYTHSCTYIHTEVIYTQLHRLP